VSRPPERPPAPPLPGGPTDGEGERAHHPEHDALPPLVRPGPPVPPDSPAVLAALPVHVVVRDFPETLAVFRRFGVDVPRRGAAPVSAAVAGDAGPLLDALAQATAWRRIDPGGGGSAGR